MSSRPQETTASGRGGMCSRVTGMSPHMGVRQGTTGFARGVPLKYARIPPSTAGGMNGLPSPLGGEGQGEGEIILSSPPP